MNDTDPRRRPGTDEALLAVALPPPGRSELERLKEGLGARAASAGLLDVAYRFVDSPLGTLLLAATDAGLVRVAFAVEGFEGVLDDLAEHISPRLLRTSARLEAPARELGEYFDGRRQQFDLDLDLQLSHGFRRSVVERLAKIPYGQHTSYGALAAELEHPGASRAVGTACATNPLPVILPCHRVRCGPTGAWAATSAAQPPSAGCSTSSAPAERLARRRTAHQQGDEGPERGRDQDDRDQRGVGAEDPEVDLDLLGVGSHEPDQEGRGERDQDDAGVVLALAARLLLTCSLTFDLLASVPCSQSSPPERRMARSLLRGLSLDEGRVVGEDRRGQPADGGSQLGVGGRLPHRGDLRQRVSPGLDKPVADLNAVLGQLHPAVG